MRRTLLTIWLLALLILAACGAPKVAPGQAATQSPALSEQETPMPAYKELFIEFGDLRIGIFDDANIVLAELPPPVGTFEAESCAYQGMDYFYYYDGFQLMVNEIDGARKITSISIKDDLFKTPQGVKFGLSSAEVKQLMSPLDIELVEDVNVLQYIDCQTVLKLRFDLDKLVGAEYTPYLAE